jgi:hypothetical protein
LWPPSWWWAGVKTAATDQQRPPYTKIIGRVEYIDRAGALRPLRSNTILSRYPSHISSHKSHAVVVRRSVLVTPLTCKDA